MYKEKNIIKTYIKNIDSIHIRWKIFKMILIIIVIIFAFMMLINRFEQKNNINNENPDINAIYKDNNIKENDKYNSKKTSMAVYKNKRKKIIQNIELNFHKIIETINNRYVYINADKTKIMIGSNLKEIQNDFYDVSFEVVDTNKETGLVEVRINKLWKNIESFDGNKLYEEEYVNEIIQVLNLLLFQDIDELQKEIIQKEVIKKYIEVKKPKQQAENKKIIYTQELLLKKYILKFGEEENKLLIIVKLRG